MSILSDSIKNYLISQYYHELKNHLAYTARASLAEYKGLTGIAGFFAKQAAGEQDHAARVLKYLQDRNECLQPQSVESPGLTPEDITQWFVTSLEIERATTEKLKTLALMAWDEMDLQTFYWASDLVMEQTEEENIIQTVLDRIASINSPSLVADLDAWIGGL